MRLLVVSAILLSSCSPATSQEPWAVVSPKGHASLVESYLKALSSSELPPFDEAAAIAEASKRFPDYPLPDRNEFETKEAFQKRVDAITSENQNAARQRNSAVEETRNRHAAQQQASNLAKQQAEALAKQRRETLVVMFQTKAPPYDIDRKQFPALPIPERRLGDATYGLADMVLDFKTEPVSCSDVELAKKIRATSDGGNLWAVLELKNAEIQITKGSETVQRGTMEQLGESVLKSAPEIGIRLIAEYFNPGSTRNAPFMPQKVEQSRSIPKVTVRISGEAPRYLYLYDAREKTSWKFEK